jgi:hypothetical protein
LGVAVDFEMVVALGGLYIPDGMSVSPALRERELGCLLFETLASGHRARLPFGAASAIRFYGRVRRRGEGLNYQKSLYCTNRRLAVFELRLPSAS